MVNFPGAGAPTKFSIEEEKEFVAKIIEDCENGAAITMRILLRLAHDYFGVPTLTESWGRGLLRRHGCVCPSNIRYNYHLLHNVHTRRFGPARLTLRKPEMVHRTSAYRTLQVAHQQLQSMWYTITLKRRSTFSWGNRRFKASLK
jgi:hypothetical protein